MAADTTFRIVLFGGAHLDRVARSHPPFRPAASNPGVSREAIGGASFNAARALSRLGAAAHVVSARGGDAIGLAIEAALEEEAIGDGALCWLDRRSASYTAILDDTGELRAAIADMDIYDLLTPRALRRRHIRNILGRADACLIDANLPAATLDSLALELHRPFLFGIAVSPAKVVRFRPCLPALDALFLSRAEAASLLGGSDDAPAPDLAYALMRSGLRRCVVTDGPRPAAILNEGLVCLQPAPDVPDVRDVTGAGDTLAAVTLLAYLSGTSFVSAVRVGMCAAALHIADELPAGSLDRCHALAATLPSPIPVPQDFSA